MNSPSRLALVLFALLVSGHALAAKCFPDIAYYRYVGDMASDAMCTDNDIQSAIDKATCPGTTIVITREHTYTAQALSIQGKSLTLTAVGDGVKCGSNPVFCDPDLGCGGGNPPPTAPLVTLDGTANNMGKGGRVLSIGGTSNVTLKFLEIKGGDLTGTTTGDGGGIGFLGTGSLTLDTSTVDNNSAEYGGGLDVEADGGDTTLTIGKNTQIHDNTASVSGGGVRLQGHGTDQVRLYMLGDANDSSIYLNTATKYGGGLELVGPARADIASPGAFLVGAVSNNTAADGGGIAIIAGDGDAVARLFTAAPSQPVLVSNNTATALGGGIYQLPSTDSNYNVHAANVCLYNFRVDGNIAPDGAAIYADTDGDYGSSIYINPTGACGPETPASLGAVACAPGVPCNEVNGNATEDSGGNSTDGAVIGGNRLYGLFANRLKLQDSQAGTGIELNYTWFVPQTLADCLISDNQFTDQAVAVDQFYYQTGDSLAISGCTVSHNSSDLGRVFQADNSDFSLTDSIIDEPGLRTLDFSDSGTITASYVMSNETSTLPVGTGVLQGAPAFADAAQGNYHLLPTSLGIDFAPAGGGVDLDGRPRDVDLSTLPNQYGPRDLGAYERQSALACDDNADALFCNGFELQP